jgi:hypothetical protein
MAALTTVWPSWLTASGASADIQPPTPTRANVVGADQQGGSARELLRGRSPRRGHSLAGGRQHDEVVAVDDLVAGRVPQHRRQHRRRRRRTRHAGSRARLI